MIWGHIEDVSSYRVFWAFNVVQGISYGPLPTLKGSEPWVDALKLASQDITLPMAQNSPKALYNMVFGPKSLKI